MLVLWSACLVEQRRSGARRRSTSGITRINPVTPALLDDLVRAAACEVLAVRGLDLAALPADTGVELSLIHI